MRLGSLLLLASAAAVTACYSPGSPHDEAPPEASLQEAPVGAPGSGGGGGGSSGTTPGGGGGGGGGNPSDPAALNERKAQMLTSLWENDTTVFQYGFARNNGDGYGYTVGRIGFTTATGDAAEVVVCFDKAFGANNNRLRKYESALVALRDKMIASGEMQSDTSTLDTIGDFTSDWTATAADSVAAPSFDGCQDQLVDAAYWKPTLAIASEWGLTSALARASLYDAVVVHGEDHVRDLARSTNDDVGNGAQTPATAPLPRAAESAWLQAFLVHRAALVAGDDAWRGAIARVANYEQQRRNGNFDFTQQIVTDARANVVFPGNGYPSNGYEACVIAPDGMVSGPSQCTAPISQ